MAKKETGEDILRAIQAKGSQRVQEQIAKVLAEQEEAVAEVKAETKGKLSKKEVREVFDDLYDKKAPSRRKEFINNYDDKENNREVEFDEFYKRHEAERQAKLKIELARAFNEMYAAKHKQREALNTDSDEKRRENAEYKRDTSELKYRVGNMGSLQRENNYLLRESVTLQIKSVAALNEIASKISGIGGGSTLGNIATSALTSIVTSIVTSMFAARGFARGTDYAPKGPALVGELGPELIQSQDGSARLTGNGPEPTILDEGDKVIPADETKKALAPAGGTQPAQQTPSRPAIPPRNLAGATDNKPAAPKREERSADKSLTLSAREIKFVADKIMFEVDTFKVETTERAEQQASSSSDSEPAPLNLKPVTPARATPAVTESVRQESSTEKNTGDQGGTGGYAAYNPTTRTQPQANRPVTTTPQNPPGELKGEEVTKQAGVQSAATPSRETGGARTGGSRSWRNNNPGNIEYGEFARSMGATGSDGRFAIFPDYNAGRQAQEKLLFEGKNYKNLTVGQAIARWAPGSENNVPAYIRAMGGDSSKRMSEYTPEERAKLLDAMQRHEGWKPGNTELAEAKPKQPVREARSTMSDAPTRGGGAVQEPRADSTAPATPVKKPTASAPPNQSPKPEKVGGDDAAALWQRYNETGAPGDFIKASEAAKMVPKELATPQQITPPPKKKAEPNVVVAPAASKRTAAPVPPKKVNGKPTHEGGSSPETKTPTAGDTDTAQRFAKYFGYIFKGNKNTGVQMDVA